MARLKSAVLESPASLSPAVRRAIFEGEEGALPKDLAAYAGKVKRSAYAITDADVEALKRAGHSEDVIFEATGAAALAAALVRLERGMTVLRASAQ
jgi:hypothetical protein